MKARTKFLKMFYKLPEQARQELIINLSNEEMLHNPYSLNTVAIEVRNNTMLSKRMLNALGYDNEI